MDIALIVFCCIAGYLLGSLNSSLIVGKLYGVDVRQHGSGNAGATNTLRTLGKKAAILVTLGDVLKGIVACILGWFFTRNIAGGEYGLMATGMGAILGHNWPLYFKFKGGKGVLTSFAVVIMLDIKVSIVLLLFFVIVVAISRFISLGSIASAGVFPIVAFIHKPHDMAYIAFALMFGILVIARHKMNISRILNGSESKFGSKKT